MVGFILIFISQFTGFYYTFDDQNRYMRADGYLVCYVVPLIMLILMLSFVVQFNKRLSGSISISLLAFAIIPLIATIVQVYAYGLSLTNFAIAGVVMFLYIFALLDLNEKVTKTNKIEIDYLKAEQQKIQALFEETAEALATAIDAKDAYTHGHSTRVAEYSKRIAEASDLSEKECEEVYYAALLHDVGKIGIPDKIINKAGKLSDEEFGAIKQHPVIGRQILSSIGKSPYLCLAANYHHERYDGKGYPEGLKGEDIPRLARIIAVADAYDAMTSKRSYRDPLPQEKVREELVKGLGTQFDPIYGKIMLHFMDLDTEFDMRERVEIKEFEGNRSVYCVEYRSDFSEGIMITPAFSRIRFRFTPRNTDVECFPAIIVFDSLDGRVQTSPNMQRDMSYYEYADIRIGGDITPKGIRNHTVKTTYGYTEAGISLSKDEYEIQSLKIKDHILLRICGEDKTTEIVMAGPDNTRFAYISLTGQNCKISDVEIKTDSENARRDYIPRIAPEVSYIDVPAGDIPNVQLDGWRSAASEGIELTDLMQISFHSMSLPTARLIWHCPFLFIYSSDDGKVNGTNYREFALIRLDGESWEEDSFASNRILTNKSEDFGNWDDWKRKNKEGLDVDIRIKRVDNVITVSSENAGIGFRNVTTIRDDIPKLYVALTGDQCAITNIRIR
ncbi:MAG: HD-GYP domain-containing protein [Lachnospiraceae bacterium]|nr:HD-GYP domain-containing protein [Lachnospiraceae bacterium]